MKSRPARCVCVIPCCNFLSPHPKFRLRGSRSKKSGLKQTGRGGGFNSAAVSYRDGDIISGSAPELGADNDPTQ